MITIDMIPFLMTAALIGYVVYASIRIHRKQDEVIKALRKQLREIAARRYIEPCITLEVQEEMFLDGKERTYETPHGALHVTPDPKHVIGAES